MEIFSEGADNRLSGVTKSMLVLLLSTAFFGAGIMVGNTASVIGGAIGQIWGLYLVIEHAPEIPHEGFDYYFASSMVVILLGLGAFLFMFSIMSQEWILLLDSVIPLIAGYNLYWRGS